MNIQDFSDLTQFMADETFKMQENFGIKKHSEKLIKFQEKTLIKYVKLYDKPLYRKAKRELAFQEALDTMPHCWIWKIFHPDLWLKIKKQIPKDTLQEKTQPAQQTATDILYPEVVKSMAVPQVADLDENC